MTLDSSLEESYKNDDTDEDSDDDVLASMLTSTKKTQKKKKNKKKEKPSNDDEDDEDDPLVITRPSTSTKLKKKSKSNNNNDVKKKSNKKKKLPKSKAKAEASTKSSSNEVENQSLVEIEWGNRNVLEALVMSQKDATKSDVEDMTNSDLIREILDLYKPLELKLAAASIASEVYPGRQSDIIKKVQTMSRDKLMDELVILIEKKIKMNDTNVAKA